MLLFGQHVNIVYSHKNEGARCRCCCLVIGEHSVQYGVQTGEDRVL